MAQLLALTHMIPFANIFRLVRILIHLSEFKIQTLSAFSDMHRMKSRNAMNTKFIFHQGYFPGPKLLGLKIGLRIDCPSTR